MGTKTSEQKKVTLATVKSFIKRNKEKLFINVKRTFDGMTDSIEERDGGVHPAVMKDWHMEHTLGIQGAWFVGGGRDYFRDYNEGGFVGYTISNSCGSFVLAIEVIE